MQRAVAHPTSAATTEALVDWLTSPEAWIALVTLTALEIVLGIDNIIFISILAGKLPEAEQSKARRVGLGAALITRILLLLSLAWIVRLTAPLFEVMGHGVSGRDLILMGGGLFLLGKATHEIHERLEGEEEHHDASRPRASFTAVIVQIMLLDIVFSLDSVITAVGMANEVSVMIIAVIIAVGIMLLAADAISGFVNEHPTVKMLALAFLLMIGTSLVAEGLHFHIPKGYIYFAMAFSVLVEILNLASRRKQRHEEPVHLRPTYVKDAPEDEPHPVAASTPHPAPVTERAGLAGSAPPAAAADDGPGRRPGAAP
jgi:predicted tellurium resistance membrane protein TerC